ncbi:hypothetical protein D3C78_1017450 [compost metagenome]
MPQGDARAIRIDLMGIEPQLLSDGTGLRGKGLVGLDHIHVGNRQPGALERHLSRRHRTDAHQHGIDPGMSISHQAGHRLEAATLGGGTLHQHHGSGAVVQTGSITGSHAAFGTIKGRLEAGEILDRQVRAHMLISVENALTTTTAQGKGENLLLEAPLLDGSDCTAMRL